MPVSNDELLTKLRDAVNAIDAALLTTQNLDEVSELRNALTLATQAIRRQPGPPGGPSGGTRPT